MISLLRSFEGGCHCAALGFSFQTALPVARWSVRACGCRFCRAHGAVTTSDPTGRLVFHVNQGEWLQRYRFGLMSHIFDGFGKVTGEIPERHNGVLVSNENGEAVAYALFNLQERGRLFVGPGEKLYEGMIIGIHNRDNDLVVNPIRTKKLTNIRAAGKDDAILLTPPIQLTLEYAVEFIADDELVEVTPASIRIRKRFLKEQERKRAARTDAAATGTA